MSASLRRGVLQICVQAELQGDQSSLSAHRHLNDLIDRVVETLGNLNLPATWALSHQSFERLEKPLSRLKDQELALLVDSSWCTSALNRKDLVRELSRRLDLVRDRKSHVSTLVLSNTEIGRHVEALPDLGIHVVRQMVDDSVNFRKRSTSNSRHGVLMVTPSAVIPSRPGLLVRWDSAYSAKRSLWKSMTQRSAQHIVVDLGKLVAMPKSRVRQLERWLRTVARLQQAGRLEIELLHAARQRRCPAKPSNAQRSILRAA